MTVLNSQCSSAEAALQHVTELNDRCLRSILVDVRSRSSLETTILHDSNAEPHVDALYGLWENGRTACGDCRRSIVAHTARGVRSRGSRATWSVEVRYAATDGVASETPARPCSMKTRVSGVDGFSAGRVDISWLKRGDQVAGMDRTADYYDAFLHQAGLALFASLHVEMKQHLASEFRSQPPSPAIRLCMAVSI